MEVDVVLDAPASPQQAQADARDAARLDWLDQQEYLHALKWASRWPDRTEHVTRFYNRDRAVIGSGASVREAIDAAIAAATTTNNTTEK